MNRVNVWFTALWASMSRDYWRCIVRQLCATWPTAHDDAVFGENTGLSEMCGKKVKVIHLTYCLLVKESHCRSAQVWHALSTDFTVLPALPRVYPRME